jgi:DNA-binding transcriptional ArsR family regulator
MLRSLFETFKITGHFSLGIIIAIIAIIIWLVVGKPGLRKNKRKEMLRALHKDGECEILSSGDALTETLTGEWVEAQQAAKELLDEGLVVRERRGGMVRNQPRIFLVYVLTAKGEEEVIRLFGPRPLSS